MCLQVCFVIKQHLLIRTSKYTSEQHEVHKKALPWVHKWEITSDELQVGRSGQKKKPRMARTRSDFLTRSSILSVGGDTDEDDNDGDSPHSPRHYTLPLSSQSSMEASLGESCFSDSDMVTGSPSQQNRRALYSYSSASLSSLTSPQQRERAQIWVSPQTELQHVPAVFTCTVTFCRKGRHFKNTSRQILRLKWYKNILEKL